MRTWCQQDINEICCTVTPHWRPGEAERAFYHRTVTDVHLPDHIPCVTLGSSGVWGGLVEVWLTSKGELPRQLLMLSLSVHCDSESLIENWQEQVSNPRSHPLFSSPPTPCQTGSRVESGWHDVWPSSQQAHTSFTALLLIWLWK